MLFTKILHKIQIANSRYQDKVTIQPATQDA